MRRTIFWLAVLGVILLVIAINNSNAQELIVEIVPPTYDKLNVDSKYREYEFLGMYGWKNWFNEKRYEYPQGTYHNDDQSNLIYSFCERGECYSIMIEEMKSKFLIHESSVI